MSVCDHNLMTTFMLLTLVDQVLDTVCLYVCDHNLMTTFMLLTLVDEVLDTVYLYVITI